MESRQKQKLSQARKAVEPTNALQPLQGTKKFVSENGQDLDKVFKFAKKQLKRKDTRSDRVYDKNLLAA
jgi:hypothetical protein